jgi:parallel beta-helix repeat protein
MTRRPRALPALALLAAASLCGSAAAETLTCTEIASLPATISTSGHYCLNANFSAAYASNAITIANNNVVLDCNDHTITQTGSALVTGITAGNRYNNTIRNCNLVGFNRGISLSENVAFTSRNNRVIGNDVRRSKLSGIQVAGTANVVEGNRVTENLGGASSYTYGILISSFNGVGVGNVVRNNVVANIAPSVYVRVTGIYLLDVDNSAVVNNIVTALFPPMDLGVYGIVGSPGSLNNAAVGNTVLAATGTPPGGGGGISYGGASYDGIRFDADPDSVNRNACRDNVVGHFVSNILVESATAGCVSSQNTTF